MSVAAQISVLLGCSLPSKPMLKEFLNPDISEKTESTTHSPINTVNLGVVAMFVDIDRTLFYKLLVQKELASFLSDPFIYLFLSG